ncbi:MAG: PhnD/SsuA/transferrin family substrate-binding protein [Rhizobiales bacterium]|nr:PhnD/SsuA/transferrin family substrate-binding protein [Hyphomicrobiales bacterium]
MSFLTRREIISGAAGLLGSATLPVRALADFTGPLRFGLTPVFLSNDLELLASFQTFLERATSQPVQLVTRRTYQEITALLVSGELDAAWICGYPFVKFRQQLSLVAVPIWKGRSLYQSYLIARAGRPAQGIDDLRGDVHAFSDPDSNSGYLVTRALLGERGIGPDTFFRKAFFTYGHRNVIRAVGSGLAQSGSVDGYVYEVVQEVEPSLVKSTEVVRKSEWLGFPPIACPIAIKDSEPISKLKAGLLAMNQDQTGRTVLDMLRLDGFASEEPSLFDAIAHKAQLVDSLG